MLEQIRKRVRSLVQFLDPAQGQIIYTDFEDQLGAPEKIPYGPSATALSRYAASVMHFLKNEVNHIVLQKLKRNINELERIFFESGEIGTRGDFETAFGKQEKLGLFIRGLIGLDRHEAKLVFADFLDGQRYSSNQIEFVNLIVDGRRIGGRLIVFL